MKLKGVAGFFVRIVAKEVCLRDKEGMKE